MPSDKTYFGNGIILNKSINPKIDISMPKRTMIFKKESKK
jgi:hypothetical protein